MKYEALGDNALAAMQYDLMALSAIKEVYNRYIPWSNAAMRPAAVQVALNDILLNRRQVVVELGSGISTAFLSAFLAAQGGRLISIDHESNWIAQVESWLSPEQRAVTTFLHAPLADYHYDGAMVSWYDVGTVERGLKESGPVGLLIVDGPPAYQTEHCVARGPAMQVIRSFLQSSATIMLDDVNRSGEQQIARDWSGLLGVSHRDLTVEAGIALWRLSTAFNLSY